MQRRRFLRNSGLVALSWTAAPKIYPWLFPEKLLAAGAAKEDNPNWADFSQGATARASSHSQVPTWGYLPTNVFGDVLQGSWETDNETVGAWLEVKFPQARPIRELWLLSKPVPYDIVLDPYMRTSAMVVPRKITYAFSDGTSSTAELRLTSYFQIVTLPQEVQTQSIKIVVQDLWPDSGKGGTGLGKVRAFPRPHASTFEISVYGMYDVIESKPVQAATVEIINPGKEIADARLQVSQGGSVSATLPLQPIPAQSVTKQDVWIPAPFEDAVMDFRLLSGNDVFQVSRNLRVPAYRSYFENGTFNWLCTNHNDLGWLDTQAVTADYRSAELILPAMKFLNEDADFRYCMESVVYLREFLERHPEKREEIAQFMRQKRFTWGASYVQVQEVHVGPEKLVRQFYLGRRWLRKNFPGADTRYYFKTDPPSMTWQMPQILAQAGVKYIIQGRFPWGFYIWEGLDGTRIPMFAFRYADPKKLPNPKSNQGWLKFATEREYYYAPRQLPPMMIYDFNGDYLPPPAPLLPYVREQNAAMKHFAEKWNEHYAGRPDRQIHPPVMRFVEPETVLDEFFGHDNLNIDTVKGDWPFPWAYYDEPANREGLLTGREGHNLLLAAERLYAALMQHDSTLAYPQADFEKAWEADCWPDHGWGGNRGVLTDAVYVQSYQKSKDLAQKLLSDVGERAARLVPKGAANQLPVAVFNPLAWAREDVVHCRFELPQGWNGFTLRDDAGREVPYEIVSPNSRERQLEFIFVADSVPSVGLRTYYLEAAPSGPVLPKPLRGDTFENEFLRVTLGAGGLKSVYDRRSKWEVLRTNKFFGGEVIQLTATGMAWEDVEAVTMADFDKTSNHDFPVTRFVEGPVRTTVVREAQFRLFRLRERFHLYKRLDRLEAEIEVLDWRGEKERELRVAFPINLDSALTSYEVPFGSFEMGKDEVDFSGLPVSPDAQFQSRLYGGEKPLTFREAINWIDASSEKYGSVGCLASSDCTVHLFKDETTDPVLYPVLQHVLLSTRKSLAWNPDYWFTQKGSHRYRMALYPHRGNWRARFRDGIGFNYPLMAFVGPQGSGASERPLTHAAEFLRLEPANLVMTAMKKSEDDDRLVVRFYEAEGRAVNAHVRLLRHPKQAWKTNLIEEDQDPLALSADGAIVFPVKPWEIVTIKFAV